MNNFIQSIRLRNFLSFGPNTPELKLMPLNVLIGPNGTGKSNLIEAINLFRSAANKDLTEPINRGGGVGEWLWKGNPRSYEAEINATFAIPNRTSLRHVIHFAEVADHIQIVDEAIEDAQKRDPNADDVYFYYRYQRGHPVLNTLSATNDEYNDKRFQRRLRAENLQPDKSVVAQRRDPDLYPEITYLADQYARMMIYQEWNFGRHTLPRGYQPADLPNIRLMENFQNLGLVLNNLKHKVRKQLINNLQDLYEDVEDISVRISGGNVQVFLIENDHPIPATRLSDGTLRYLCLLAILYDPTPPPLICIEEPELGLHPDIIPGLANLLKEASERTQLIVTTHSNILVDALTDTPEAVIVCEKHNGATIMQRLAQTDLESWLQEYSLGELWRRGDLGGNRW